MESAVNQHSAQPCGCDPGCDHYCAEHKFREAAIAMCKKWRTVANCYFDLDGESCAFEQCADELESLLQ